MKVVSEKSFTIMIFILNRTKLFYNYFRLSERMSRNTVNGIDKTSSGREMVCQKVEISTSEDFHFEQCKPEKMSRSKKRKRTVSSDHSCEDKMIRGGLKKVAKEKPLIDGDAKRLKAESVKVRSY